MDHAMQVEQWKFEQSIVFSKSNIEQEKDVLYLPWYMILFFMQEKEPEKLIYEIDLGGLQRELREINFIRLRLTRL